MQLDPLPKAVHPDPHHPAGLTRDFSEKPTTEHRKRRRRPAIGDLRADARARAARAQPARAVKRSDPRAASEDETTGQVDITSCARRGAPASPRCIPSWTPIDARSAEILDDIDPPRRAAAVRASGAFRAAIETREERKRRRITALLERATEWARSSDFRARGDRGRSRAVRGSQQRTRPEADPPQPRGHNEPRSRRSSATSAHAGARSPAARAWAPRRSVHARVPAVARRRYADRSTRSSTSPACPRLEAYRYLCQLLLRGILR